MMSTAAAGAVVVAALLAVQGVAALTAVTGWRQGQASFYGGAPDGMSPEQASYGTEEGSCGYGVLQKNAWPYWSVGALATANMYFQADPLDGCGECFEVECLEDGPAFGAKPGSCQQDPKSRSIVIQITDSCPECQPDQIDMQALVWAQIANPSPSGGRVNIQYRKVECAPPTDLIVDVDNNLQSGWIRLQITSAGGPANVKNVELRGGGSGWENANNLFGAAWEMPQRPQPPIDVRITNGNGDQVIAPGVIKLDQTGNLPTSTQFKISDPGDVQPSGSVLSGKEAKTGSSSKSSASSSPPNDQVQAFEGPPDDSSPAPPAPPPSPNASAGGSGGSPPWTQPPSPAPWSQPPSPSQSPSPSPSPSGSPSPPAPSSDESSCEDNDPGNSQSCDANKASGNCDQWWLRAGNYCAKTCGNCGSGSSVQDSSAQDSG